VNLSLDSGGGAGNITVVAIDGHSSETVTIDAGTGTTSVGAIGAGTEIGAVSIGSTGNGGITLNGAITTTGIIDLDGPITLAGATTLDSSGGNANIFFRHAVDGGQTLTVSSGSGAVDFAGIIGGTTALGDTTINAAGTGTIDLFDVGDGSPSAGIDGTLTVGNTSTTEVEFDGLNYDVSGNILIKSASGEKIKFTDATDAAIDFRTTGSGSTIGFDTGTIKISDRDAAAAALGITSDNGNITIAAIEGTHDEDITINSGSGTLAVGAIGVSTVEGINTVILTSSTGITLSGSITTSNAAGSNVDQ
jgi:hypothetical protein